MGTSSDRAEGRGGAWTSLKHAATSYAKTTSTGAPSATSARRVLTLYPAVLGGAAAAATSSRAGGRGVANLGGFLAGVGGNGLAATLAEFGLADLVGQSRFDVLDALVTRCVGDGSDIEAQAARDAYCEALDALFVDANTWVELDAATVSVDTVTDILKLFLVHYIFNRLPVLPERLARTLSPDAARQADAQVLELIAGLVEVHLPPDPLTFDWRGPAGQSFAELTLLDAYQIIEAEGQRS